MSCTHFHFRNEQLELKEQRTQISNTIQNLQASKKNHLQKFGRHIPQLARELQEAVRRGSFRKPPKGPLGALLQLKDERWALATESCLRGLPYSYLVDNDQDAKVLRQIMGKVMGQERKPSIIISSFMGRVCSPKPMCLSVEWGRCTAARARGQTPQVRLHLIFESSPG